LNKKLGLIGDGAFSEEVKEVAQFLGYTVVGYIGDAKTSRDRPYLGSFENVKDWGQKLDFVFPAFGAVDRRGINRRADYLQKIDKLNIPVPSLISKHAMVSKQAKFDRGVFVAPGTVINFDAYIEEFCIINNNSTIGHEVRIGKGTVVSGNVFIGGSSIIGERTLIGPGSNIMQNLSIGQNTIVSIGSNVVRDVPRGKTIMPTIHKFL
jgi:sugar O-acyltransferase (sialic acid O-acetyltransferase NeuD family)